MLDRSPISTAVGTPTGQPGEKAKLNLSLAEKH